MDIALVATINAVSFVLGGVGISFAISAFGVKLVVQSFVFIIAVAYFLNVLIADDNPGYDPQSLTKL